MKFISRQFPNMTVMNMKFEDGVGETTDKETIAYIKEFGARYDIWLETEAPPIAERPAQTIIPGTGSFMGRILGEVQGVLNDIEGTKE